VINDGTATNGRKGLPYDWQSLLADDSITESSSSPIDGAIERVLVGAD